mmetsp:Transcript_20113/g.60032  ORF Transcript_20113/g.60032 Transcript_20113/m.60032 type:complete len:204 (-) Transcript_20113:12-623(-)
MAALCVTRLCRVVRDRDHHPTGGLGWQSDLAEATQRHNRARHPLRLHLGGWVPPGGRERARRYGADARRPPDYWGGPTRRPIGPKSDSVGQGLAEPHLYHRGTANILRAIELVGARRRQGRLCDDPWPHHGALPIDRPNAAQLDLGQCHLLPDAWRRRRHVLPTPSSRWGALGVHSYVAVRFSQRWHRLLRTRTLQRGCGGFR